MGSQIDEHIIKALKEARKPVTAYVIAKKLDVSWPTVVNHCMNLLIEHKIERKVESSLSGKKTLWEARTR